MTPRSALTYVPLLLLAVVGAFAAFRRAPSAPLELPPGAPPAATASRPSQSARPGEGRSSPEGLASAADAAPPMTPAEVRDFHVHLAH
jgi:hypothetical protein